MAGVLLVMLIACGGDDSSTGAGGSSTSSASGGGDGGATTGSTGGATSAGGTGGAGGTTATGGGGPSGSVPCGGEDCSASEVCCFDNTTTTQVRCDAPGACDAGQIELSCNHPDDCGGGSTCCSAFDGVVQTMLCQTTCAAADEFVMCSSAMGMGPDQAACPMGTTCSNAQAGQGYHYCAK
jgi:hypothetical protein